MNQINKNGDKARICTISPHQQVCLLAGHKWHTPRVYAWDTRVLLLRSAPHTPRAPSMRLRARAGALDPLLESTDCNLGERVHAVGFRGPSSNVYLSLPAETTHTPTHSLCRIYKSSGVERDAYTQKDNPIAAHAMQI